MTGIVNQAMKDANIYFDCSTPNWDHYESEFRNYEGTMQKAAISDDNKIIFVSANGVTGVELTSAAIRWLFLEASARGWYDG